MPWTDSAETVVAGSGELYFAPVGTTLPAVNSDPTAALPSEWVGAGYIAQDGVSFKGILELSEFFAWQSTSAIRRGRKTQSQEIGCELLQWNEENLVLAFGGGAVTNAGGFYTYTFPVAGDALAEKAVVLDLVDGERHMRIVQPRMNVSDTVETTFNADNMATLALVLTSLAHATAPYIISDDAAAFAAGS